jgi:hypothetical protein
MTMTTTTSTLSRRGWLSRLLMAAVAPLVSVTMTETVDADKKDTKKQRREARIKKEVNQFRKDCSAGGGTFTVSKKPGGTTATCTGGDYAGEEGDGTSCTFHSKGTRCFLVRTDPTSPIAPGDGGSTPPISSPVDGGGTAPPPPSCTLKPLGASCSTGGECCSGGCNGLCCLPDGAACVNPGDCCGGICSGGICSSLT